MASMTPPVGIPDADGTLDALALSSIELIADTTCVLTGFGIVALSVIADDAERLCTIAVSGNDDARATLLGTDLPVKTVAEALAVGDRHGHYIFVPADRDRGPSLLEAPTWVPPISASEDPERWHPDDILMAPLLDEDGRLQGVLGLDLPADGRRPAGADWDHLQVYAQQARNGLLAVLERRRVAQQLHHLESARDLIRAAIHTPDEPLSSVLRRVGDTLTSHFDVAAAWFRVFGAPGLPPTTVESAGPQAPPVELGFLPYVERIAQRLWTDQVLAVIGRSERRHVDETNTGAVEMAHSFIERHQLESMLYAPLGLGADALGLVILIRSAGAPRWSEVECEAMLEIGRDLGVLVAGAIARQRDEDLLADLRALDAYKSEMVATVSHELKNPLAAIGTSLELLADAASPGEAEQLLGAVRRNVERMARIVTDLQTFGAADSPSQRRHTRVDLALIAEEACAAAAEAAAARELRMSVDTTAGPVLVAGNALELDRLVGNLVSNAIKYSRPGGQVRVAVEAGAGVAVLVVADDGIGISAEDQELLFTEFFRSSNSEALGQPGTGLGLAIVRRIVERHGGRIELDSGLGRGSTFRVLLPQEQA
jgi:signal transduction histidine kinase